MMHPGVKKQALDMQRRLEIDQISLYSAIKKVRKDCSVCQACNLDNRNIKGEAQWTPVPDQPMESVAITSSPCPNFTYARRPLIVWSFVWTATAAT